MTEFEHNGKRFRVETEREDVTMSGLFGHRPSTHREFIPGIQHFFIDDVSVTKEAFIQALKDAGIDFK